MTDRLKCVVPFCNRTSKKERDHETVCICSIHWRGTKKITRRVYRRAKAAGDQQKEWRAFQRLSKQATEAL